MSPPQSITMAVRRQQSTGDDEEGAKFDYTRATGDRFSPFPPPPGSRRRKKNLRQIKSSHLRSFAESPVETDLPFSLRNLFPSYSPSLFPPLHSPKIQCHGQSPLPPPSQHDPFIRGGSKGAADFLLLGRWRRITLFTMCKRLTEFSNRRPGLCRKALLLLLLIPSPELELEKANHVAAVVPLSASCSPPFCLMNYGFLSFSILLLMRARKVLEVTSRGMRRKKNFPQSFPPTFQYIWVYYLLRLFFWGREPLL